MTVESIKQAIAELPSDQMASLAAWLNRLDRQSWDEQIEADFSPGGPGMALLEEAEADAQAGRVKPLEELLTEVNAGRQIRPPR